MTLTLYKSTADKLVIDKSGYLTTITQLDGVLKTPTSYLNPTISIYKPSLWDSSINYVYLDVYKRYYYITDVIYTNANILELHLKVDTLFSFKDLILKQYAYVERSTTKYDKNIVDNLLNFEYKKVVAIRYPYESTSYYVEYYPISLSGLDSNSYNCVLDVMSKQVYYKTDFTYVDSLPSSSTYFPTIKQIYSSSQTSSNVIALTGLESAYLCQKIVNNDVYKSYIKKLNVYPFSITTTRLSDTYFYIGDYNFDLSSFPNNNVNLPNPLVRRWVYMSWNFGSSTFLKWLTNGQLKSSSDISFYNMNPYMQIELYIPFHGWEMINLEECLGCEIQLIYQCDLQFNESSCFLWNKTSHMILGKWNIILGVTLGLSTSNALEINNQKATTAISSVLSTLTSLLAIGGGVATANPMMVAGGGLGIAKTITTTASSISSMNVKGSTDMSSFSDGLTTQLTPYFKTTYSPKYYDTSIRGTYGYPLKQRILLSDLESGYVQTSSFDFRNVLSTDNLPSLSEQDEIKNLLNNGVRIYD